MCIIVVKKPGLQLPDKEALVNCWTNNPNGAGFMYAINNRVHIEKGFFDFENFFSAVTAINDIVSLPAVLHFRFGSHGDISVENTHPFPITENLSVMRRLSCKTRLAAAHNGIIPGIIPRDNISDTMEYIITQLAPMYRRRKDFYRLSDVHNMIEGATSSKWAFLDNAGNIELIGSFICNNGILYSNDSYKEVS
jgi:hypothetical protein